MAKLIALTPCGELLPISIGGVTVTEVQVDRMLSVAPFKGQQKKISAMLKDQIGSGLPAANRRSGPVTWFGHGGYMVSADVTLDAAVVTDQSDAWAVVQIEGDTVEAVLARLVPVDLRATVFKKNHVAKTMLGHMSVTIVRVEANAFEITVMRSMAQTLIHDLETAMQGVAAR